MSPAEFNDLAARLAERGDTPLPLFDPDASAGGPIDLDEEVDS